MPLLAEIILAEDTVCKDAVCKVLPWLLSSLTEEEAVAKLALCSNVAALLND
jgi:hypothetical protein